jgi:hypothetical protein
MYVTIARHLVKAVRANCKRQICQEDSFEVLEVNTKTLSLLLQHHSVMPELETMAAIFCKKSEATEEAFCSGVSVRDSETTYGKNLLNTSSPLSFCF